MSRASWIRPEKRWAIYARDDFTCVLCGVVYLPGDGVKGNLTIDHVTPRCLGGNNEAANLVTMCRRCNQNRTGAHRVLHDPQEGLTPVARTEARARVRRTVKRGLTRRTAHYRFAAGVMKVVSDARCPWCPSACVHCVAGLLGIE